MARQNPPLRTNSLFTYDEAIRRHAYERTLALALEEPEMSVQDFAALSYLRGIEDAAASREEESDAPDPVPHHRSGGGEFSDAGEEFGWPDKAKGEG